MAHLTYDGSAQDHEVIPQVLTTGKNGQPNKRDVKVPAQTVFKNLDEYDLWGMRFPAGEPREVLDKAMIKKAAAMRCFTVRLEKDEPVTFDKEWLSLALQDARVKIVETLAVAFPPVATANRAPKLAPDTYDEMKRVKLIQLASARGLSINPSLTKPQIIEKLRIGDAAVSAEVAAEGPRLNLDAMQDVG